MARPKRDPVADLGEFGLRRMPGAPEETDAALLARIAPCRMEAPYAYYTDDGVLKSWGHNHVVTDHEEILHLKERGARLSEIKS
jgi:hypothetical protein